MTTNRRGLAYGVAAYLLWGLFPLYWPYLEPAGAAEVLAHRVVWSLGFVALLLWVGVRRRRAGRAGASEVEGLRALRGDTRRLRLLAVAAVLIGGNWLLYIWAVNHEHVLETSLGYYINPLVTVLLAVAVLGERLRPAQWSAMGIAAAGTLVLTVQNGRPPWIALALAVTFAAYALIKKTVGVGAVAGLTVETGVLFIPALALLAVLAADGSGTLTSEGPGHTLLLMSAGVATAIPLLLFAGAASRVSLTTIGLLQYLAPTLQFAIGVGVAHEPLPPLRLFGFAIVWAALVVFTVDGIRSHRRALRLAAQPVA